MIPLLWACCTAWQTERNNSSRSRVVSCSRIAVVDDRDALHQLHHEVGPAAVGRAGIEHPGDVGVVHQGQRLPLRLEPGDDIARIHARLDDLQGHLAADGVLLLGDEDQAEPPLADLLHEFIGTDDRAGALGDRLVILGRVRARRNILKKAARGVVGVQERFDFSAQLRVGATGLVEVRGPAIGGQLDGRLENAALGHGALRHSDGRSRFPCANGAETPGDFGHPGAFFCSPRSHCRRSHALE